MMDSRGIPIVVQTTKKKPATPNRNSLTPNRNSLTPRRHDIQSYVYPNLKNETSLLDAYDSFTDACFQSHYNHSMLTEDCRYNIHDLFKSDCYATDMNTTSVPTSPKSNHSQSKRIRSTLSIDTDTPEAQVPILEACKKLKLESLSAKIDIVSSPIEATTPLGEDMEEALDTIMNTATQQNRENTAMEEELYDRSNQIASTTPTTSPDDDTKEGPILRHSTISVEPSDDPKELVTPKTLFRRYSIDTPEMHTSLPLCENKDTAPLQIDIINSLAAIETLHVPTEVPPEPVAEDPGTLTEKSTTESIVEKDVPTDKSIMEPVVDTPTKRSDVEPVVKKDPSTPRKKSDKKPVDQGPSSRTRRSRKESSATPPVRMQRVTRSQMRGKNTEFAIPELPLPKRASSRKKKEPVPSTNDAEPEVSQVEEISSKVASPVDKEAKKLQVKRTLTQQEKERIMHEVRRKESVKKEISKLLERFPSLADDYELLDRPGYGTFSRVYKAIDLKADYYVSSDYQTIDKENKYVVIKLILDISTPERVINEIKCLMSLKSLPGVTQLITAFRHESLTFVVLPYIEFDHFENFYENMTLADTKSYISELLIGLQSTHQTGIMHRDVKPGNFLYSTKTKKGCLADFGLAQRSSSELYTHKQSSQALESKKEYTQDQNSQAGYYHNDSRPTLQADRSGTKGFRAPEVMMRHKHQTTAVDIWAVGVILLIILSGRYPFFEPEDDPDGIMELAHVFGLKKMSEFSVFYGRTFRTNIPTIPEEELDFEPFLREINPDHVSKWDPEEFRLAIDLMKKCLQLIHTNRVSATEALCHPFFETKHTVL